MPIGTIFKNPPQGRLFRQTKVSRNFSVKISQAQLSQKYFYTFSIEEIPETQQSAEKCISQLKLVYEYYRAGHFWYFLVLFNKKNDFVSFFIKLITYFCASPI